MVPWWYVPVSLTPLPLIPLMAAMFRGGLKIIILDEDFRPSVGRVRRGKWVTYINKDRGVHMVEFYNQQEPDQVRTLTNIVADVGHPCGAGLMSLIGYIFPLPPMLHECHNPGRERRDGGAT
jgi:hypothetical protein